MTRIEGHLRIDCEVDNGKVTKAWSSGQMWRGIELILQGRDPRDAWIFTQRICGVCTTVHAIASVRAVENALNLEVPLNAQYIRNMMVLAHGIHDHIVHFYHLSALDWVDIVSALKANPRKTAQLAESLSSWPMNSAHHMEQAQAKLQTFVSSGQLGVFASGYWGHPAMKLSPEVNLLATAHYLQALEYQRKANQIVTILGSKTPHIQNLAVGGVTNAINLDSQSALGMERLFYIKPSWTNWVISSTTFTWSTWPPSARCTPIGQNMARGSQITSPCPICRWIPRGQNSSCQAVISRTRICPSSNRSPVTRTPIFRRA
jgi:hydrogenase large subunit